MNIGNITVEVSMSNKAISRFKDLFEFASCEYPIQHEDYSYNEGYKEALRAVADILEEDGAFECKSS